MKNSTLKRLFSYVKPYSFLLILSLICAIANVALTLLNPVLIGDTIDLMIGQNNVNFNGIVKLLIYILITIILASFTQWLMTRCTNVISYKTVRDLRIEAFDKLNKVPLKYIDNTPHGDIISKIITDIDQISDGLLQGFSQAFTGIITILGTLIFMFSINVKIALIVVVVTPLSLFVASFITKHSHSMYVKQSEVRGEMTSYVEEMIGNQKVVKAFSHEDNAQKCFEEINARLYDCGFKAQFYSALANPSTRFVNSIVYACVGVIGALSALKGTLTVGEISCFLTYANQYTKPFNEISGVVTQFQAALASAERVFNLLDEVNEREDSKTSKEIAKACGKIDIENVSFSYAKDNKLIENFNLHVKPGDNIAIVGPTGCGKTTLINLLMRFYNIDGGSIKIDNLDIKDIKRNSSRGLFGMVLQDTWLFSGTVRENIAYGAENATLDEVITAAKNAHAHEFIKKLPKGYDTVLSDDGCNLSQGQKQLLCIARVMLTKPSMLILDEATSNIDTRTEVYIQKAFAKMMENRTSFIVAHRLSTIREADLILVMKDGKVIEQGKHQDLLEQQGFYYNLYNSQFAK